MALNEQFADYQSNNKVFDLYITYPKDVAIKLPTVIVAPAWDGLNEPIKAITQRVAELGYQAVAIDVYGQGVRGDVTGDNSGLMNPLLENRALLEDRLLSATAAVMELKTTDSSKVAAIGYCFGGLCVLDLARVNAPGIAGVISFHGILTTNGSEQTSPIKSKILVEHGWDDPLAPPPQFLAFTDEMTKRQADWQCHVHGGVMHSFTFEQANAPEQGVQYHPAAASRSWKAMREFFGEVFG